MDKPRRRFDPLALAFLSLALAAALGIGVYLLFSLRAASNEQARSSPPADAQESDRLANAIAEVRAWLQDSRPPTVAPSAQTPAKTSPAKATPTRCAPIALPQPLPPPPGVA